MKIHALVFLSNHDHRLLSPRDAEALARFMNYINSNIAREAERLCNWNEQLWRRRYQAVVVADEASPAPGPFVTAASHEEPALASSA